MPRTQRGRVFVDTAQFKRDMATLTAGLTAGADTESRRQAERTAGRVRDNVPVRTGTLAATVGVAGETRAWGVTYGGGLPYAGYIEKRSHPVRKGSRGARREFTAALGAMTGKVAHRL